MPRARRKICTRCRATAGRTRALAPLADHSARSDACEEGIVGCSAPAAEKSSLSSWGSTTNLGRMDVPNWTWSAHRRRTPLYGTSSGSAGACEREGRDPRHVARQPQRVRLRRNARVRSHGPTGGARDRHADPNFQLEAAETMLTGGRVESRNDWYDLRVGRTAKLLSFLSAFP